MSIFVHSRPVDNASILVLLGDKMGDEMTRAESGRRPTKSLTARFVETVTQPGKYFDGNGLFLRVEPNGSRRWVQRITINGKRSELGLGSPPATSLANARAQALENKGKVQRGEDPLADKRKARDGMTFGDAVERYLDVKLEEYRNEKHRKQWRSTLETYANPHLGKKLVSEITMQDVLRVLEPIWREKTETATRVRGRIESVLSWATAAGYREGENPARWKGNLSEMLAKPNKLAQVDNQPALALIDACRWWADLNGRDGMAAEALRFLTLTAARSGEVRGMTWDEVDLATNTHDGTALGTWNIPGSRMKNGRPHRVPLSAQARKILDRLPRLEGCPYVFFAPKGGKLSDMSLSAVMRRIQEAQTKAKKPGYLDPVSKRPAVPHGLRSTFRQWAAEKGYPRDMSELALAHWIGSEVERAYQRADMLERRRSMMEDWSAFLQASTQKQEPRAPRAKRRAS